MSDENDGNEAQYFAEVGQQEQRIEEAKRMSLAIEAHRKWVQEFNAKEIEDGTVRAG